MGRYSDLVSKAARGFDATKIPATKPGETGSQSPLIKLDSNENPFGPSPRALEAMSGALDTSSLYPDDECGRLRGALASYHGLPIEQVLITAGSTAMLDLLCRTLLAPGLNAVTSQRSFIVYSMAVRAAGGQLVEVAMRDDCFDLEAILAAVNSQTRIVFLANPNNPTGTMLEAPAIDRFLARLPKHVTVILDEAYYEFAEHFAGLRTIKYSNSLDYVRHDASVVVLRTFSKAHGLAGLRVGYGLGPAELLTYCERMRYPYSVSSLAQAAALAAFEDVAHVRKAVENNATQSQVLQDGLRTLGYRVVPTSANFLFCDLGENATPVAERLHEAGVAVRPLQNWGSGTRACRRESPSAYRQSD